MGALSFPRRVVALFPRQPIEIGSVPERAIICFGNVECHHTVRYVGPVDRAVEPAKCAVITQNFQGLRTL
jgi:hypothetical protein